MTVQPVIIKTLTDENGKLHNDKGPAITYSNGREVYYNHGTFHRLDGPAIFDQDVGIDMWIVNGKALTDIHYFAVSTGIDLNNLTTHDKTILFMKYGLFPEE